MAHQRQRRYAGHLIGIRDAVVFFSPWCAERIVTASNVTVKCSIRWALATGTRRF
jgi:hypothetical protein